MQILFHQCGQALEVAEGLNGRATNQFVFLDVATSDGYDRCPKCGKTLAIGDFKCQAPVRVSQEKNRAPISPVQAEGRRLIRKARAVIASRRVARVGL